MMINPRDISPVVKEHEEAFRQVVRRLEGMNIIPSGMSSSSLDKMLDHPQVAVMAAGFSYDPKKKTGSYFLAAFHGEVALGGQYRFSL